VSDPYRLKAGALNLPAHPVNLFCGSGGLLVERVGFSTLDC
jgi:hypothetical protein